MKKRWQKLDESIKTLVICKCLMFAFRLENIFPKSSMRFYKVDPAHLHIFILFFIHFITVGSVSSFV